MAGQVVGLIGTIFFFFFAIALQGQPKVSWFFVWFGSILLGQIIILCGRVQHAVTCPFCSFPLEVRSRKLKLAALNFCPKCGDSFDKPVPAK